ncbi:MAG: hypothetical protein JJLCMIEE_03513 [Acidimicrobiales bacterium]|nr:MAG: class E sortase [Actinomycetota bacterium]MBV6510373.1 hypothetical protein [Acidimicrobiales bacterium]RIK03210.1 MAG: hypothetical protein DCC48_17000 [Acidobacteriota bacterium]
MTVTTPDAEHDDGPPRSDHAAPPPAPARKVSLARVLGWIGKTLIWLGALILLFVVYQLWGTGLEEARAQDSLEEELIEDLSTDLGIEEGLESIDELTEWLSGLAIETAPATATQPLDSPMGIISIPRIGLEKVFVEGTGTEQLKKGPGHYVGTPLPGQAGNAGIAGHRTTYGAPFNRIDELLPGDEITVWTGQGGFRYQVMPPQTAGAIEVGAGYWTVRPDQAEVLEDYGDNRITLTACHPKYSADQRIVVAAELVDTPAPAPTEEPADDDAGSGDEVVAEESAAETELDLDESLAGDSSALVPTILWGLGLLTLGVIAWLVGRAWRRWPTYLIAAPFFLVVMFFWFQQIDRLLPAY